MAAASSGRGCEGGVDAVDLVTSVLAAPGGGVAAAGGAGDGQDGLVGRCVDGTAKDSWSSDPESARVPGATTAADLGVVATAAVPGWDEDGEGVHEVASCGRGLSGT